MAFFDEEESMKLGTLAIAIPQRSGQTYISSVLLGERNMITTKILAEHFSKAFNCIALVSTHLAEITEGRITTTLLKLTQKLIEKTESKQHFKSSN